MTDLELITRMLRNARIGFREEYQQPDYFEKWYWKVTVEYPSSEVAYLFNSKQEVLDALVWKRED